MAKSPIIRVLFDSQIFLLQKHGGISRYFTELYKAFEDHPSLGVVPSTDAKWVLNAYAIKAFESLSPRIIGSRWVALILLLQKLVQKRPKKQDFDIIHFTYYFPGFLKKYQKNLKVVSLFDMIPERTKDVFRLWNPHLAKRAYIEKADGVLSISKATTADMRRIYGSKRTTRTTYLGVGPEFSPGLQRLSSLPLQYFLFVGNRSGYKDCAAAFRAFAIVSRHFSSVFLVLAGGEKFSRSESALAGELNILDKVKHVKIDGKNLPSLYSNALALLYPTRIEGFGLPLVEAMASGTPIIASDTEINQEICGDVATYFPPGDAVAFGALLNSLLSKPGAFASKVSSGVERANVFTWFRCAEQTALVYRELISKQQQGVLQ